MWLYNLDEDTGCRIYSVQATQLHCDNPNTAADEGITWHQTAATEGDNYAVIEVHPPNVEDGGSPELQLTAGVGLGANTAINCTGPRSTISSPGEPSELNTAITRTPTASRASWLSWRSRFATGRAVTNARRTWPTSQVTRRIRPSSACASTST